MQYASQRSNLTFRHDFEILRIRCHPSARTLPFLQTGVEFISAEGALFETSPLLVVGRSLFGWSLAGWFACLLAMLLAWLLAWLIAYCNCLVDLSVVCLLIWLLHLVGRLLVYLVGYQLITAWLLGCLVAWLVAVNNNCKFRRYHHTMVFSFKHFLN